MKGNLTICEIVLGYVDSISNKCLLFSLMCLYLVTNGNTYAYIRNFIKHEQYYHTLWKYVLSAFYYRKFCVPITKKYQFANLLKGQAWNRIKHCFNRNIYLYSWEATCCQQKYNTKINGMKQISCNCELTSSP